VGLPETPAALPIFLRALRDDGFCVTYIRMKGT